MTILANLKSLKDELNQLSGPKPNVARWNAALDDAINLIGSGPEHVINAPSTLEREQQAEHEAAMQVRRDQYNKLKDKDPDQAAAMLDQYPELADAPEQTAVTEAMKEPNPFEKAPLLPPQDVELKSPAVTTAESKEVNPVPPNPSFPGPAPTVNEAPPTQPADSH